MAQILSTPGEGMYVDHPIMSPLSTEHFSDQLNSIQAFLDKGDTDRAAYYLSDLNVHISPADHTLGEIMLSPRFHAISQDVAALSDHLADIRDGLMASPEHLAEFKPIADDLIVLMDKMQSAYPDIVRHDNRLGMRSILEAKQATRSHGQQYGVTKKLASGQELRNAISRQIGNQGVDVLTIFSSLELANFNADLRKILEKLKKFQATHDSIPLQPTQRLFLFVMVILLWVNILNGAYTGLSKMAGDQTVQDHNNQTFTYDNPPSPNNLITSPKQTNLEIDADTVRFDDQNATLLNNLTEVTLADIGVDPSELSFISPPVPSLQMTEVSTGNKEYTVIETATLDDVKQFASNIPLEMVGDAMANPFAGFTFPGGGTTLTAQVLLNAMPAGTTFAHPFPGAHILSSNPFNFQNKRLYHEHDSRHPGNDLVSNNPGAPNDYIYNMIDGVVVAVGRSGLGNHGVIVRVTLEGVKDANGNELCLFLLYGHSDGLDDIHVGDVIKAGDRIGHVGSEGVSDGPHLHIGAVLAPARAIPINFKEGDYLHFDNVNYTFDFETTIDAVMKAEQSRNLSPQKLEKEHKVVQYENFEEIAATITNVQRSPLLIWAGEHPDIVKQLFSNKVFPALEGTNLKPDLGFCLNLLAQYIYYNKSYVTAYDIEQGLSFIGTVFPLGKDTRSTELNPLMVDAMQQVLEESGKGVGDANLVDLYQSLIDTGYFVDAPGNLKISPALQRMPVMSTLSAYWEANKSNADFAKSLFPEDSATGVKRGFATAIVDSAFGGPGAYPKTWHDMEVRSEMYELALQLADMAYPQGIILGQAEPNPLQYLRVHFLENWRNSWTNSDHYSAQTLKSHQLDLVGQRDADLNALRDLVQKWQDQGSIDMQSVVSGLENADQIVGFLRAKPIVQGLLDWAKPPAGSNQLDPNMSALLGNRFGATGFRTIVAAGTTNITFPAVESLTPDQTLVGVATEYDRQLAVAVQQSIDIWDTGTPPENPTHPVPVQVQQRWRAMIAYYGLQIDVPTLWKHLMAERPLFDSFTYEGVNLDGTNGISNWMINESYSDFLTRIHGNEQGNLNTIVNDPQGSKLLSEIVRRYINNNLTPYPAVDQLINQDAAADMVFLQNRSDIFNQAWTLANYINVSGKYADNANTLDPVKSTISRWARAIIVGNSLEPGAPTTLAELYNRMVEMQKAAQAANDSIDLMKDVPTDIANWGPAMDLMGYYNFLRDQNSVGYNMNATLANMPKEEVIFLNNYINEKTNNTNPGSFADIAQRANYYNEAIDAFGVVFPEGKVVRSPTTSSYITFMMQNAYLNGQLPNGQSFSMVNFVTWVNSIKGLVVHNSKVATDGWAIGQTFLDYINTLPGYNNAQKSAMSTYVTQHPVPTVDEQGQLVSDDVYRARRQHIVDQASLLLDLINPNNTIFAGHPIGNPGTQEFTVNFEANNSDNLEVVLQRFIPKSVINATDPVAAYAQWKSYLQSHGDDLSALMNPKDNRSADEIVTGFVLSS